MNNAPTGTTSFSRAPQEWVDAFYAGWRAALKNEPPATECDAWDKTRQFAYEAGRLAIANIRGAGLTVPPWDGTRDGSTAAYRTMQEAYMLTGNAVPPARDRLLYA